MERDAALRRARDAEAKYARAATDIGALLKHHDTASKGVLRLIDEALLTHQGAMKAARHETRGIAATGHEMARDALASLHDEVEAYLARPVPE